MSIWHRVTIDKSRSKVCGVCAGIAQAFGYNSMTIRVAAVAGLIFIPVVTVAAYATAAILLPTRQQSII